MDETLGSLLPAAIITLLLHLSLYGVARHTTLLNVVVVGRTPRLTPHAPVLRADAADKPVPAHLLPPAMRPAPPKFVEVNPMAPSAKPDHARNTGAADQRAAQPEPDAAKTSDSPRVAGTEKASSRIINAIPREFLPKDMRPAPGQPLGGDTAPPAKIPPTAKAETPKPRPPGPVADRKGLAFSDKPQPTTPEKTAQKADTKRPPAKPSATRATPGDDDIPDTAAPRPKASLAGTSGPLGINLAGVSDKGSLALDARFSRMGEYAARFYEIIQAAWWVSVDRARVAERGQVVIEFTLHSDGSVSDARITSSSTSDRAALLCLDAIVGRAPYDKWPEDMIGMYGEKQEGRITFTYY